MLTKKWVARNKRGCVIFEKNTLHLHYYLFLLRCVSLSDSVFEQINENLPPLYRNLKDKIKDPSSKERTESVVLLADSTKIRCAKPSNRTKQSGLFYQPKGGQNVTQLHLTTLDGTVVFVGSMAASSSPRLV